MPTKGFKKPPEYRRDKRVHALFTEAELSQVKASAEAAGMSVSAYLRSVALGSSPRAKPSRAASELVREMNRIGVNLNQLVKAAHAGRYPHESDLQIVTADLLAAIQKVA